jgi:RIMS-binding protein 2
MNFKGRSLAPASLLAQNITQTSAIISWWPSSSTFAHTLTIDSIEHKQLRPGVYRYKLSGLLPNTSHLITVSAHIQSSSASNAPREQQPSNNLNNYASNLEFRTLPTKQLDIPQQLKLDRDKKDYENFILTWQPTIVSANDTTSNGIAVGGYSIYLDGVKIHQILNPLG